MIGSTVDVTEQYSFETWSLPNNLDICIRCQRDCTVPAHHVALGLIEIEKDKSLNRRSARSADEFDSADGHLNARQRIACSRPKLFDDEVKRSVGCPHHIVEDADIPYFGCSFASNINRPPLRPEGTTLTHPIIGTPPYAPPRYFR